MVPIIEKMEVVPVAGRDSMLLNLSGAHEPFFTRNIVILTASNGEEGIGEVPGGKKITQILNESQDLVLGTPLGDYKKVIRDVKKRFGELDSKGRGLQTFDQRVCIHAQTAIETAFLDLLGKYLKVPVAALLGDGVQRKKIPVLGYLFYIGDRKKTDLPYVKGEGAEDSWERLRREPALTPAAVVRLAQAAYERYGFTTFKLKGGVFNGETEVATIKALHQAFPMAKLDLDPNGSWSLKQAIRYTKSLKGILHYIEDPCGAEDGFSGREILAEFQRQTHVPVATNMVDTNWRQMAHSLTLGAVSIPLADPHFWTMEGSVEVAKICQAFSLNWGIHSNNHFDISLAMAIHAAAAAPGEIYAIDTHWIWQDGQNLTKDSYQIKDGFISLKPDSVGLGVTIDRQKLIQAHRLYIQNTCDQRNDARPMQYLIPNWRFDPHRPALVR